MNTANEAAVKAYEAKESPALVSIEAEQSVLGGLLLDNGAIDRVGSILKPEHFSRDDHRKIFVAVSSLLMANKPADMLTVFEELRSRGWSDCLPYLNALSQSVPSAANIHRYAGIVFERFKARQLVQVGIRAVEIAQDATTPIDDRIERMQGEIGKLSEQAAQREAVPLAEAMLRQIDAIQDRADGKVRVFPTGIPDLDYMLGGGMKPADLIIIAARPSMGKTALAMTAALSQAKEHSVGFLSMEMSEAALSDRVIASLGHVDLRFVQQPAQAKGDFWDRVTEAAHLAASLNLYIDDQGALTIHQVAAKARNMKRKHSIDLLYVDYLQLMSGTDSRISRTYQLEEITRGLKALAKALGIAVVALAQVNRKVEGGSPYAMPTLGDLKDSGAIEQDADVVAFVHRPIHFDPSIGDDWKYYAKVRLSKQRQGPTGDVNLSYFGSETRFAGWSGAEPVKQGRKGSDL